MKKCKYCRTQRVPLGKGTLEYNTCTLADATAMIHPDQCFECQIVELEKDFDCVHMRAVKQLRAVAGLKSS